jgi:hypothetical protein
MDFSFQKFFNETFQGQNGPWDKVVFGHSILSKFATKSPHFQGKDCPSLKTKLNTIHKDRNSLTHNIHTF